MEEDIDEDEWLRGIKKAQSTAIEAARDHLISMDRQHMMKAPKSVDKFEVGEFVLIEQGSSFRRGPDDKLLPFLADPYDILKIKGSEYTVRNCITRRSKVVHLAKLTRYIVNDFQRTPQEAAMRDFGDIFMVDKIVEGVMGNELKGPVSRLRFRVSWVGYPGEDTIEPWKAVRNLEAFREFLESHSSKGYRELVKRLPRSNGPEDEEGEEEYDCDLISREEVLAKSSERKRRSLRKPGGKRNNRV
jgi:hypothetical protein